MHRALTALVVTATLAAANVSLAGGGGMMGSGSGMQGGAGMLVVADDSSLLVTEMSMQGMMGGGTPSLRRALINITSNGVERWRRDFSDGWPMMPVTQGDLVVFALVDFWWMGSGTGDTGGQGGGGTALSGQVVLKGLAPASGTERWSVTLTGDMASMAQFSPDGSHLYVTTRSHGGGQTSGAPVRQGDVSGSDGTMTTTVVALDRNATILWSKSLATTRSMQGDQ